MRQFHHAKLPCRFLGRSQRVAATEQSLAPQTDASTRWAQEGALHLWEGLKLVREGCRPSGVAVPREWGLEATSRVEWLPEFLCPLIAAGAAFWHHRSPLR